MVQHVGQCVVFVEVKYADMFSVASINLLSPFPLLFLLKWRRSSICPKLNLDLIVATCETFRWS